LKRKGFRFAERLAEMGLPYVQGDLREKGHAMEKLASVCGTRRSDGWGRDMNFIGSAWNVKEAKTSKPQLLPSSRFPKRTPP